MTSATGIDYMAHLYAKVRADGITVPIFHNDKGRNGDWVPGSFPAPDSNYLYAFDGYPVGQRRPAGLGLLRPGRGQGRRQRQPGHARDSRPSSAAAASTRGAALPGRARATASSGPSTGPPTSGSST